MSNPAFRPEDRQRFALRVQTPVRAYAVASVCSLAGALLIVNWLVQGWPTLVGVLAIALLGFGIALNVAALVLKHRYQTTIMIERDTVTLINGRRRRVLNWTEVAEVTLEGPRLIFKFKGDGQRQVVLFVPRQTDRGLFDDLVEAMQRRLDASRGYRP
ncbi:MAG TPA: hypothetical protein VIT42_09595 [Microlunatus sp.]